MPKSTKVNNNEELQGELTTANDLAILLNANYRTVRKILATMHKEGKLKEGSLIRANRETVAYYVNNSTIKAVQQELKAIRNKKKTIANTVVSTNARNIDNNSITGSSRTLHYNTANDIANVKIYEVMKENNDLSNKVLALEKEVQEKEVERVKIESDLYKTQADLRLIEDKQKTFEAENSRLAQELSKQEKALNTRNIIIIALSVILIIIATVSITILLIH